MLIFGGLIFGGKFVLVIRGLIFRGAYVRGGAYIRDFTVCEGPSKNYITTNFGHF